ncbi:hypothetical protein LTR99_009357 [Exophiala xenobiotica]|uniref:BTB domain-containing protein n=1 Tax=Vermiconidia calcicola TaxID=1690605 RepID=A0AAV9PXF0_9PEZI|nr:hypothetical protein H2202_001863 [Exophiala xenobiotica]KAK5530969.1 hypothetical protein LTR25_008826 [Vermiconidia calcicola]KAK5544461.1 hypothetical protein LTR23_004549 [Chaetothyriales sp. CCFEE 6169]KAK5197940.1 hypothetical protein LTR92_002185 [Exophiala xenobiotica]KAK5210279.1 hypothetical protein LTR41_003947 [Exophiala xenobiotica]
MAQNNAVAAGMTAHHARSPNIRVIVGQWDEYADTDSGLVQLNVFYINKSFLVQHSRFFAILLDTAPPRDIVRLQIPNNDRLCDDKEEYEVFADWLDAMYRWEEGGSKLDVREYWDINQRLEFADFVGSPKYKNMVMDSIQQHPSNEWSVRELDSLTLLVGSADLYVDYAIECLAYRIVTEGWTVFAQADRVEDNNEWQEFLRHESEQFELGSLKKLLVRVDELNEAKDAGKLIDPTARKDCKWHEHTNEEREKCPRYRQEENVVGVDFHRKEDGKQPSGQ